MSNCKHISGWITRNESQSVVIATCMKCGEVKRWTFHTKNLYTEGSDTWYRDSLRLHDFIVGYLLAFDEPVLIDDVAAAMGVNIQAVFNSVMRRKETILLNRIQRGQTFLSITKRESIAS